MTGRGPKTFSDRLFDVVRNFIEYGNYARDINKAARIIHKHHPDISLATCEAEFRKYMAAYIDAISFVDEHKDYYRRQWDTESAGIRTEIKGRNAFLEKTSRCS